MDLFCAMYKESVSSKSSAWGGGDDYFLLPPERIPINSRRSNDDEFSNLLAKLKFSKLFIYVARKETRTVCYIDFNTNVGKLKAVIHFSDFCLRRKNTLFCEP